MNRSTDPNNAVMADNLAQTRLPSNVVLFPGASAAKSPLLAEFEDLIQLIELLMASAQVKNERLMLAFEQSAVKHHCQTSLALADCFKEVDNHINLALLALSQPTSPGNKSHHANDSVSEVAE